MHFKPSVRGTVLLAPASSPPPVGLLGHYMPVWYMLAVCAQ